MDRIRFSRLWLLIMALIVAIVGTVLFIMSFVEYSIHSMIAGGKVTDVAVIGNNEWHAQVEYSVLDKEYTANINGVIDRPAEGQQWTVYYNKNAPEDVSVRDITKSIVAGGCACFTFSTVIAIGVFILYVQEKSDDEATPV